MNRLLLFCAIMLCTTNIFGQQKTDTLVMTKSKGMYVINTTTLCTTRGFKDTTPLIVTVKKDKIESVEALPNRETPRYFERIKQEMLPAFAGLKFEDHSKVDAVTGATMSSKAVQAHMAEALKYYKANK